MAHARTCAEIAASASLGPAFERSLHQVFAALLEHLAEVDARGLHRTRACSSLYTYCVYELRFSEDAAARRSAAAKFARRFPAILGAVAA
ncbi:MAG TPA: hypothetical protein VNN72_14730, partial [Polyangiaceae bacterium]|nr:hypothetical protein [Polyangiaceae bacterium]